MLPIKYIMNYPASEYMYRIKSVFIRGIYLC